MSEHKFRYLLQPGTDFKFVQKFKAWMWLSVVFTVATIAIILVNKQVRGDYMNWTIDFKGGTELIFAFKDDKGAYVSPDPGKARERCTRPARRASTSRRSRGRRPSAAGRSPCRA